MPTFPTADEVAVVIVAIARGLRFGYFPFRWNISDGRRAVASGRGLLEPALPSRD